MSHTTGLANHPNTSVHPKYRPDINGLRAVAVISVLLFHAFPSLLPGGFVGVDIFFVISGFLITTIIFQNLANGTFSFADFYVRRVRRIFPALLLVLATCLVVGWFTLVADEYAQLGKHIAAGAGFVSNLALWSESGYFDTASSAKPLLHLWSLGIEEQFYLLWPLLVFCAWKKHYKLLSATLVVLLASFAANLFSVGVDAPAAYYSPVGRFWELLVGAALAFKLSPVRGSSWTLPFPHRFAAAGLLMVMAALALIDQHSLFPGWWAWVPVAGAALLIGAGEDAWVNRHVLSSRPMVWIGLISYPLYLWHWPLLSFAEILAGQVPPPQYRLICLLLAMVLAWLTYLVVERPYRNKNYRLRSALILGACMAVLGFLGWDIAHRDGLPFRHEQLSASKPDTARSAGFTSLGVSILKDQRQDSCIDMLTRTSKRVDVFCHLIGTRPSLAVIGDSHSNHLLYGLKNSANPKLNQVLVVGAGGCQPALNAGQSENCDDQSRANLALIEKFDSIRFVALSADSSWIQTRNAAQYDALVLGYLKTAAQLQKLGITVLYIVDTPGFKTSPVACAPNPLPARNRYNVSSDVCQKLPVGKILPRDGYDRFVQDLAAKNKAIQWVDAYALFCDITHCQVVDDNSLIFKDTNHLTDYGSTLLAHRLNAFIH